MATKYIKVSEEAKDDLRAATIQNGRLDLAGQCKKYSELKKLFSEIGVVWNKKDKTHYLDSGAEEQIDFILNGGQIVDEKKTLQAFFTPESLAKRVVEIADVNNRDVLEPSAGEGALVKECIKQGAKYIKCEEINPKFADKLDGLAINTNTQMTIVSGFDFLNSKPNKYFERVVMNPPYDNNTWVKHIEHAWKHLAKNGKLVAVCPNARQNNLFLKFIKDKNYCIYDVESGAFKSEGTNVNVMILEVNNY